VLRRARFDAREADFYEALYTQSRASFGAYVETGTLLNNYAHIFDLLIRWGVVETGGRTDCQALGCVLAGAWHPSGV